MYKQQKQERKKSFAENWKFLVDGKTQNLKLLLSFEEKMMLFLPPSNGFQKLLQPHIDHTNKREEIFMLFSLD